VLPPLNSIVAATLLAEWHGKHGSDRFEHFLDQPRGDVRAPAGALVYRFASALSISGAIANEQP